MMNSEQSDQNIFYPLEKNAVISKHARNLPHWEQSCRSYFVTFRLCDSLPQAQLIALSEEKERWLKHHPKPWSKSDVSEYEKNYFNKVEEWLNAGHGCCILKNPETSLIVENALRYFDNDRYVLDEFVIMPSHVHVIFKPLRHHILSQILHSWKSFTANEIKRICGKTGNLWMRENFDHIIRSWDHLTKFREYIRKNPEKAELRKDEYLLGKGKNPLQPQNSQI
jgi:putative transposase